MNPSVPGYRIRRELGKGGMGLVYLADRERDGLPVALKILPPNLINPVSARRFQREGLALQSLDHPQIVKVYDVACRGGQHFIAMEYVEGRPLSRRLGEARNRKLELHVALRYARDIAKALDAIHTRGMTHRDLKPGNIMVTTKDEVKLLDFGLVQMDGVTMLTAEGNILGTPGYMSPEQCSGTPLDCRSDIYAFGVLLHEMLSGAPPFSAESVYELLEMQRKASPPPLRASNPEIPASLEQVVLHCLEKDPAQRPARLTDVLPRLDGVGNAAIPNGAPRPEKSSGSLVRVVVPALLLLAAAVAFVFSSELPAARALRANLDSRLREWTEPGASGEDTLQSEVEDSLRSLMSAKAFYAEGLRQQDRGELEKAFVAFRRAAELYPGKIEHLTSLIGTGTSLDRLDEVTEIVQDALATDPSVDPEGTLRNWLDGRAR